MEKSKLKRLILTAGIILGNALLWSESASAANCNAFGNQGRLPDGTVSHGKRWVRRGQLGYRFKCTDFRLDRNYQGRNLGAIYDLWLDNVDERSLVWRGNQATNYDRKQYRSCP